MNTSGLPGVGSDTSTQAIIKQIARDASTPASELNGRVPCRTTAYKGCSQKIKKQRGGQKKPQKKAPHVIIEK